MTLAQQIVQSNHAAIAIAQKVKIDGTPNIVLIGVPDKDGLEKVIHTCKWFGIEYAAFMESYGEIGLTAIATEPLDTRRKQVFADYKLWIPLTPCSLDAKHPASAGRPEPSALPGGPVQEAPMAQR